MINLTYRQVDKSGVKCTAGGGTTVLESHDWVYGPGGQGVFNDPSLGPVLYYHYGKPNLLYSYGVYSTDRKQWIPALGMPMVKSSSESTSSASQVDGPWYNCSLVFLSTSTLLSPEASLYFDSVHT